LKKVKKFSATVLTVGLLASTSIPAFATQNEKVDTSNFETVNLQDALANVKEKTTTVEDLQTIATNIPVGYLANNLFALSMNMEKISNPKAKAALQKNIDKAVAKWEKKNNVDLTAADATTETPIVDGSESVTPNVSEKTEKEVDEKAESKSAKAIDKKQSKEARNAVKEERKQAQKAKKEERKIEHAAKKEEQRKHKAHKKESKGNKHKD